MRVAMLRERKWTSISAVSVATVGSTSSLYKGFSYGLVNHAFIYWLAEVSSSTSCVALVFWPSAIATAIGLAGRHSAF